MQLFMVKVESSDDNSTEWFFVAARDEVEARELVADCTSHLVELIATPADMAEVVDHEFSGVALVVSQ
jgi:hypothetical protein